MYGKYDVFALKMYFINIFIAKIYQLNIFMTEHYYKRYPQFSNFARLLSNLELKDPNDYQNHQREEIYKQLRLPIKVFKGDKKSQIDTLIKDYFNIENFLFTVISSEGGESQIHTDVSPRKEPQFQRYCNLAFPLSGNFTNRITYWPSLDNKDRRDLYSYSAVNDNSLHKYQSHDSWNCSIAHQQYCPVLLNTELAHGVRADSSTLFGYITLIGKSFNDCKDLYDSILI